ncbi:MAG: hypothetical protein PUC44_07320 [Eubacteriales bacterium]|nr:hypothetical protein [Eubacteriales bacterium]
MDTSNFFKRIGHYMNFSYLKEQNKRRFYVWIFWIAFMVFLWFFPTKYVPGTILCLLPIAGQFAYAILTHEVYEALILGTIANYIFWYKGAFMTKFVDNTVKNLQDGETILMIASFLLCGGMIVMFTRSGVTVSFGKFLTKKFGKSEKRILTSAGIIAGVMSVDDYISSLTNGAAFSPIMNNIKKPRMALSFMIKTFSTCASCLLPYGAWGFYIIYQIEAAKNVDGLMDAFHIFLRTIPYQFFPICACVICLLFAFGKMPKLGKMKDAYEAAERGEQYGAAEKTSGDDIELIDEMVAADPRKQNVGVFNLVIPIIILIIAMFATGFNGFLCFIIPMIICGFMYILQGIFRLDEYIECFIQGCRDMMDMTIILILGYSLQTVLAEMSFDTFILKVCNIIPVAGLIPFFFFVYFGLEEYLVTMNYTLYLLLFPTLMVVLPQVGANVPLCIAAVISAGVFGGNNCIVSDLGIIAAKSCQVDIYDQFVCCQPYYWISFVISAALYLAVGLIF